MIKVKEYLVLVLVFFKINFVLAQVQLGLSVEFTSEDVFTGNFFTSMVDRDNLRNRYIVSFNKNEEFSFQIKTLLEVLEVRPVNKDFLMLSTNKNGGSFLKVNNKLEIIANYKAIDLNTDTHDWAFFDNSNLLLIGFYYEDRDLTDLGGKQDARVKQYVLQEIDTTLNEVVNFWDTADHFKVKESLIVNLNANNIDYVHINSIDIVKNQFVLISSKNLCEATLINWNNGEIIWRLGGLNNQFKFENDSILFSGQHHIQLNEDKLTVFDNGVLTNPMQSSAVTYLLNQSDFTATQTSRYYNQYKDFYLFMGAVHTLQNNHQVVCWGLRGAYQVSEFDDLGNEIMKSTFSTTDNYRINPANWDIEIFSLTDTLKIVQSKLEQHFTINIDNKSVHNYDIEEIRANLDGLSVSQNNLNVDGYGTFNIDLMISPHFDFTAIDTVYLQVKAWHTDSIFFEQKIPLKVIFENVNSIHEENQTKNDITVRNDKNLFIINSKHKNIKAVNLYTLNGENYYSAEMRNTHYKFEANTDFNGINFLFITFEDESKICKKIIVKR